VQYGSPRFAHIVNFGGTNIAVPYGDQGSTAAYEGQSIRFYARWLANRTDPAELIAGGNGYVATGYTSNGARGAFNPNCTFYIGGLAYGSFQASSDCGLSTCCVLDTEAVASVYDVDFFVREQYQMLS